VGPLLSNQLAVPAEDCIRRNQRRDLGQGSPSDGLAPDGQSPALNIGQSKPPTTDLFLKDSILLPQILDDRTLLAADPASQRGNEDLPGLQDGGHSLIVAR